jgi:hypothetical protein
VLEELARQGETHIGIDPEAKRVRHIAIARFVESIRNRRR